MQGLSKVIRGVVSLGFYGMMPSSFATTLGNLVGKVNEGMCLSTVGLSKIDMRGGRDDFLVSLRIL